VKGERARRQRLYELAETQRLVHHVADLDSGEIATTPLDRPVSPLSRAERLSQLGHHFSPAVFGWPSQRLTPRQPYQPSPLAWLGAYGASWYSPEYEYPGGHGVIWWELPREFEFAEPRDPGMDFRFHYAPVGRCVASISLMGYAYQDTPASVLLIAFGSEGRASVEIPIDMSFAHHTVDFTFVVPATSEAGEGVWITMGLRVGIRYLVFTGISLATEPPWIDPEPPI
jgi:hypothetical protein